MGISNWFIKLKLKGAYKSMNNDKKASVLGVVLAAIIAANVDYSKVAQLDPAACGALAGALVTAILGWFINKPDKAKPPEASK